MGKPYQSDLDLLETSYDWSINAALVDQAPNWLRICRTPLVTIGSGGSYTSAVFAAYLHEWFTGLLAKAITPLEAAQLSLRWNQYSALFLTARGSNPDILGALQHVGRGEPHCMGVMCARTESPLAHLAENFSRIQNFDFDLPSGKDGFLATNSLMATAVRQIRLYEAAFRIEAGLPPKLSALLANCTPKVIKGTDVRLWASDTLVVLHSPTTKAAALDLESKYSEAAMGNVQAVDFRHFAHGRHFWLARRGASTGIIAFIADEVKEVANRTLKLIPKTIPILTVPTSGVGPRAALAALVRAIQLVGTASSFIDHDPGKPRVPTFGRSIYHLNAFNKRSTAGISEAAIARKSGLPLSLLRTRQSLHEWERHYSDFASRIQKARFRGIVLDYDGTLVDESHRFDGLSREVARHLARLAKGNIRIGIATGRGKSVRNALQDALPKTIWKHFLIGYYNGGDIGPLSDTSCPDGACRVDESLTPIANAIRDCDFLRTFADCEFRIPQITVQPKSAVDAQAVWDHVQQLTYQFHVPGVMAIRSSHSLDVVAPFVSKQNVVERIQEELADSGPLLCIGDRGAWPGNDFVLLSNQHSLSVDEVSIDPTRCWNVAPAGMSGIQATIFYFERLTFANGAIRLSLNARPRHEARRSE